MQCYPRILWLFPVICYVYDDNKKSSDPKIWPIYPLFQSWQPHFGRLRENEKLFESKKFVASMCYNDSFQNKIFACAKKYMRFWNIAVVPLKIDSITQLGLKESKNIFGQACFYIISEYWSHLWLCHAAMFCCFFGIAFGNTKWNIVFSSLKTFVTDALNLKSPHF